MSEFKILMHHLVNEKGNRLFPPKLRLLAPWTLRDEIRADYSDAKTGLAKQRTIAKVCERIVTQTIPRAAINNPLVDWNPVTNEVKASTVKDFDTAPPRPQTPPGATEGYTRYAMLLATFQASRLADPYSPTGPMMIARRFHGNRQIPEERFRWMLEDV